MSAGTTGADETAAPPLAFAVTGGGAVTPEELAAITVALTPVAAAVETEELPGHRDGMSGWARAALIEGIGGRRPASLPDLVQGRFGLGHVG